MADWHLEELRDALARKGWSIIAELPGGNHFTSAVWEIQRSTVMPPIIIAFEGLDDLKTLPLEQSYGCYVRGRESISLYFGKRGENDSTRKRIWQNDLKRFVDDLEYKAKG